ncbi:hypothetical protein BCR44DRAFT_125497 [Catenaria anguillulae PL171]|uniref:DUF1446-domain-containing protein n=1 Tax=Catenaria anguillulae PL171 TaxID=765915 RepID=A0A1Y2HD58_9FUNG|nr:hypothetical protein BCR44DRAFT_125497 [Catenaria anguillulae PL171]
MLDKAPSAQVSIGCASAFWGDSPAAAAQLLLGHGSLDFLALDLLAEVTMGLLAKRKAAGKSGFIEEFAQRVVAPLLPAIASTRTKIITNAGGLDPIGLKNLIEDLIRKADLSITVAAVVGDNLMDNLASGNLSHLKPFSPTNAKVQDDSDRLPSRLQDVTAANAYLGAFPIVAALDAGADIVVTGRCVDSALVLSPLIHRFGWSPRDFDQLAAGSLIGHILECGTQATGGNFTDGMRSSSSSSAGWSNMGYPIALVSPNGDAHITKLAKTGGCVTRLTVGEQMCYEVLDPANYLLPDVILDLTSVTLTQVDHDLVKVTGARGRPPPNTLKVSLITHGPYVVTSELFLAGYDSRGKALATGNAIIQRVNRLLPRIAQIKEPISAYRLECLGVDAVLGPHARASDDIPHEVVLRITASHPDRRALGVLAMELAPSATSMAPGITGAGSGRPIPTRQLRHISALIPKDTLAPAQVIVGCSSPVKVVFPSTSVSNAVVRTSIPYEPPALSSWDVVAVPLICLAVARSGDKGDNCNIGVLARRSEFYPYLVQALTADVVASHFAHLLEGNVTRYLLPGSSALNFVLTTCLGGGGLSSLRIDRQGKTYGSILVSTCTVPVARNLLPLLSYQHLVNKL